jgi:preprotein translocase subunit SecG
MNSFLALLDSIPEDSIAITVYLLGSVIMLWSWYAIAKRLPKPFGGITWMVGFAILLTPTVSEGNNASIAPAFFGLLFGVLTKENALVWSNASLILFVVGLGLVVGYLWSQYTAKKAKFVVNKNSSPL